MFTHWRKAPRLEAVSYKPKNAGIKASATEENPRERPHA
jgi:hypothetical protein